MLPAFAGRTTKRVRGVKGQFTARRPRAEPRVYTGPTPLKRAAKRGP
jgi:hypothetical protein